MVPGCASAVPVPVIGLTGGIGSGKSAAADAFATHGAVIVDTDAIAHMLTGPGDGFGQRRGNRPMHHARSG